MLQHESQEPTVPSSLPASQARVTPEELNAALEALDADKQRAARLQAETVPLGEAVDGLGLDATPEQIWAQVQRQRADAAAQAAREEAAADAPREALGRAAQGVWEAAAQAVASARTPAAGRRRVRGWREMKGWLWVAFWCSGGLGLFAELPHLIHHAPPGIEVSGDRSTLTYAVPNEDVTVSGDGDTITLSGTCKTLTVSGEHNTIRVAGMVGSIVTDGNGNTVTYSRGPAPTVSNDGDGNKVQVGP